jgi:hypothetical protein
MTMSYCLIENTAPDLEECADKIEDALADQKKLSSSEYRHLATLVEAAKRIAKLDDENDLMELKP